MHAQLFTDDSFGVPLQGTPLRCCIRALAVTRIVVTDHVDEEAFRQPQKEGDATAISEREKDPQIAQIFRVCMTIQECVSRGTRRLYVCAWDTAATSIASMREKAKPWQTSQSSSFEAHSHACRTCTPEEDKGISK